MSRCLMTSQLVLTLPVSIPKVLARILVGDSIYVPPVTPNLICRMLAYNPIRRMHTQTTSYPLSSWQTSDGACD